MPSAFASPAAASAGLTAAFSPTTPEQKAAIANAAALVPAQPQQTQQTTEPTVLSSDTIDQKNQQNIQTASTQQPAGQTIAADGFARNADQSFAEAPSGATSVQDPTTGATVWQSGGLSYALGPSGGKISSDPTIQSLYDQFSTLKSQMDATGAMNIEAIKNQFTQLIQQQQQTNSAQEAGTYSLLARGGSLQTESSTGIIQSQVSYGLRQIADLNNKEQQAVIAAQTAMQNGDMQLLDKQLSIAQQARTDRQDAAQKLNDAIVTAGTQARKDMAISNILSQGVTDPKDILSKLQTQGETTISAKDIADALSNLTANTNTSLDKLSGDTKDFFLLKNQGLLPNGVSDLGSYLQYINGAKQTPLQKQTAALTFQQKSLAITRTQQLVESAKALEASRVVGSQIAHDKGVQNYLAVAPMMSRLQASEADIKANGINQSNAADLLDAITQINTGGKQITEGQISLTKDSQSYADKAVALLQKIKGQGGVIDPKIADQAIRLSTGIFSLYQGDFQQRVKVYNQRLKDVAGQDLTAYSPLTDITALPGVVDGSYENALSGNVSDTQNQINTLNAQSLLDNPPPDVTSSSSYDPNMWQTP